MTEGIESQEQQCPYCGEFVEVSVEPFGASHEEYTEDCSVCCRPWRVQITRSNDPEGESDGFDGEQVSVSLSREDD